jgi:hypothetical protein
VFLTTADGVVGENRSHATQSSTPLSGFWTETGSTS